MPRYTVDTDDAHLFVKGDESTAFRCPKAARVDALRVLGELARDKMVAGDKRVFLAVGRYDHGHPIYAATLTLSGEWMTKPLT